MALARMGRWTWFGNLVTENAHRRFCDVMTNNALDRYNGNGFHIGRPAGGGARRHLGTG